MDLNLRTPATRKESVSRYSRSTGKNLAASLHLLDEAMSPNTSGSFLKNNHNVREVTQTPFLNSSKTSSMNQRKDKLIFSTPIKQLSFEQTFLNETAKSVSEMQQNASLILSETDPDLKLAESLFEDFLQAYTTYPLENEVFNLIDKYIQLSDNQVTLLKKALKKTVVPSQNLSRTAQLNHLLQNERNTWRLLGAVYKDRLRIQDDPDAMIIDLVGKRLSDKEIVTHLYARDPVIRQNQLIIDWLEKSASSKLDSEHYDRVEYFSDHSVAWENTLNRLKLNRNKGIIDQMDPDAPVRTGKPLDDLDKEDELRLFRHLLCFIRAGQLDDAQRLCLKFGQPWRAASLEGWRLYHDPNYSVNDGTMLHDAEGNATRDVWKWACWKMAEDERIHPIERALYGVLSGNLRSLLPFCTTWDDYVWAHFRVMVDMKVEQEIRANSLKDGPFEPLPAYYWDSGLTPATVFHDLSSSTNPSIQAEAKQYFQVIQKFIILDDVDGLLAEMHEWVRNDLTLPSHVLRFFAHLVLFFRSICRISKEEYANVVLEAYVKSLIETRRIRLVASYNATLPQLLQVHWYAKFLEGISDRKDRQLCLELAENAGLDVAIITKLVVENIRNRTTDDNQTPAQPLTGARNIFESVAHDLSRNTTKEDLDKIDAVDWLMFDQAHRTEALKQANSFMRLFLASKKIDAVRAVISKIPSDTIKIITQQWLSQTGSTELPAIIDNSFREYLCFNAYLQAVDSFSDWFTHFHNSRPEPPRLTPGATFTERVAYEHLHAQYDVEINRWQNTLTHQTKATVDRLYNVLLFVDGGWMVDGVKDDGPVDELRLLQMRRLRELCLPEICLLIHAVLHSTDQHLRCLQLADIIANEEHRLFEVFRKEDLQELLDKLRDTSLVLLDRNLDPLGYLIK